MKAVAYCRVSTINQRNDGVSLEMQRERIRAWATANGYDVAAVFVEAQSGGKASNRAELQSALALACKIKGVLVVYSLSRLARSLKDTLAIVERLDRASACLASLTERIDNSSPTGRLVFQLLASLNEFERAQIADRTEAAMGHLRTQARRISPRAPFGYSFGPDGSHLIPNAAEQAALADIVGWRAAGAALQEIADRLTAAGIRPRSGRAWYASSVKAILDRNAKPGGFACAA